MKNSLKNRQLLQSIPNVPMVKVNVGNADFSWFEASFALALSLESARMLGVKFEQNALYWVDNGVLSLHSCDNPHQMTQLGALATRCINPERLTTL
ncbi:DUF3293 domain-containing protein [Vibrio sp. SM6]|uniref:DUF3293 domain-containing protein n=1 Tax=Vibrio agarilyticus TaxID=2726741 RepID=A0A7X8TPJ5_9VIBR|nr:DUF3293 domain-containing protein [Vibrio agarilyticus]